jgi:hypothetical protein
MSEQQSSEVRTIQRDASLDQRLFTFKATYIVWLLLVMLEGLLALRLGLKLIGANQANPFADLVFALSSIFLLPFAGLIGTPVAGGMALELSTLIAMAVYAMLFWVFERMVWLVFYRPRERPVAVIQRTSIEQHTR